MPDRRAMLRLVAAALLLAAVVFLSFDKTNHAVHWDDWVTVGAIATGLFAATALAAFSRRLSRMLPGRLRMDRPRQVLFARSVQGLILASWATLAAAGLGQWAWKAAVCVVATNWAMRGGRWAANRLEHRDG